MTRALPLAFAALFLASPAAATSVVATPPHQPERACSVVAGLVGELAAAKRPATGSALSGLEIVTDKLGRVGPEEWDALLIALRWNHGKADDRPMRLIALRRIDDGEEETMALYVVLVERERWELERYVGQDDLLMPLYEPEPHYETIDTFWLAAFRGNRVVSLREARELYPISFDGKAQDCRGVTATDTPIPISRPD
jgi:hypothetical protein